MRRWTEFLPTSKIKDVFVGFVELNGKAESGSDGPIIAPLSRRECVWTSRKVEELRGGYKNRRYWETIIEERCDRPFYLSDETGKVLVDPTGAEIDSEILFDEEIDARDPRFFSGGKMLRRDSCKVRCFVERGVPLDSKVYVLGKTRIDDDAVAPVVKKDDSKWVYRIVLGAEADARVSGASAEKDNFWLAVLSAANFGAAVRAILWGTGWDGSGMEFEFAGGWGGLGNVLLVGATCGAIVATLWALCATIEFTNAFIELRCCVDQARSNVDVELKRRFDLLPQLATATKLAVRYESELQTLLAALRTEGENYRLDSSEKGVRAWAPRLLAANEKTPELTANEAFENFRRSVVDAEERIAAARNYYSNISLNYETLRENFPFSLVATIFRLPEAKYMKAEGLGVETRPAVESANVRNAARKKTRNDAVSLITAAPKNDKTSSMAGETKNDEMSSRDEFASFLDDLRKGI